MRADKRTGQGIITFKSDLVGAMEILAITPESQTGWNPCAENNGYCTHLCLFRSWKEGYFCACPDEADGKPCLLGKQLIFFYYGSKKDFICICLIKNPKNE